ncbi:cyclic nucleotide-binding protein [Xanthobacter tagetidis]|uniref:Cyclic nucleotide-binding protein n=2 Tax=Xanthobacter tagetidis TaxID=60216 RepID=A0A3L7ALP1_9HYPH|nr:cyclic nucleotide-binding protein [Xanthobacter tagetidis]
MGMDHRSLRRRVFDLLERDVPGDRLADVIHFGLIAVVVVSVVIAVLGTVPSLGLRDGIAFGAIEHACLAVFVVEYLMRLWVAPEHPLRRGMPAWKASVAYAFTPFAVIDLLAIVPLAGSLFGSYELHGLLVLRLMRFLKLARYSSGFNALFLAIRRERYALFSCLLILASGVLTAATLMYLVERDMQPDQFGSIPAAMWWAITTLTTVGYGDVVPVTALGRVIGGITMVSGLVMLALPIAIIATSFSQVIAQHNFVVTLSMVSRLAPFTDLDPKALGALMPVLHSRSFDRGHLVVRKGEKTGHLYVVLEGYVEVEHPDGVERLGPGGVFGVAPGAGMEHLTVRAASKAKVLVIEENELHTLMARHPVVVARLSGMVFPKTGA